MSRIALTADPVDLIATNEDFSAGEKYIAQLERTGGQAVAHFDDSDARPVATAGWKIDKATWLAMKAGRTGKLWAWSPDAAPDAPIYVNIFEKI